MPTRDVLKNGVKVGEESYDEPAPAPTHTTMVYIDEFFSLFTPTESKDIHDSVDDNVINILRTMGYAQGRQFDMATSARITQSMAYLVAVGLITQERHDTIMEGKPL